MLSFVTDDRVEQHGGDVLGLVVHRGRLDRGLLALGQRDRQLGGRVGLLLDRLVDGHALIAVDDVLEALQRRVLARDRDLRQLALLERRDRRVGEAVVGGQHAVDLVAVLLQDLLEDRQRLLVVPVGHGLVVDLLPVTRVELRVDDGVVALLEQRRVVVGRRAVEDRDLRALLVAHAVDEALALQLADLLVVERDVVVGRVGVERQAVVVDDLDALRLGVRRDRGARARVEVHQQDDLRAVGDRLLGLLLLRRLVALGVLDLGLDAGVLERLLQRAAGRPSPSARTTSSPAAGPRPCRRRRRSTPRSPRRRRRCCSPRRRRTRRPRRLIATAAVTSQTAPFFMELPLRESVG